MRNKKNSRDERKTAVSNFLVIEEDLMSRG